MGDFDYVKIVLNRLGQMRWMQVAIKPAKPLAFGIVNELPVFGLPGNPVSSMVSYELFESLICPGFSGWEPSMSSSPVEKMPTVGVRTVAIS